MINIRPVLEGDNILLSDIFRSNCVLYDSIMPGVFSRQADKFLYEGLPSHYKIQMIEDDDKVVGFLGIRELDQDTSYLLALYIHQGSHGKGIGQESIKIYKKFCQNKRMKSMVLLVHKKATWAYEFYLKQGFTVVGSSEEAIRQYKNNIIGNCYINDTVLMSIEL